jgi:hypothetical protein
MFEKTDYIWTAPGDLVAGERTATNGLWLSIPAIIRLQNANILPGGPRP